MDWVEMAQKRVLQEATKIKKEIITTKFRAENSALAEIKVAKE